MQRQDTQKMINIQLLTTEVKVFGKKRLKNRTEGVGTEDQINCAK